MSMHLRLLPFKPAALIALIEGESGFAQQFGFTPAIGLRDFYVSGEASSEFLKRLQDAETEDPWQWGFAVIDAQQLAVGTVGFKGPPQEGQVEIAYAIVPEFQNRGYATIAADQLVKFASSSPAVKKIIAHTLPEDNASTSVLRKNGFHFTSEVNDPEDGQIWRWERLPISDLRKADD